MSDSPAIVWKAHYDDGTFLDQYSQNGHKATYADIDRQRLLAFDLWQGGRLLLRLDLRDDTGGDPQLGRRRLIWRVRRRQNNKGETLTFHLAGWQRKVAGRNIQAVNYVFEDGSILCGGQFVESDFQHGIAVLPHETDLL